MKNPSLFIIVILLSFSSCQKYQEDYSNLDTVLKNNYQLKPGSYWIYNNNLNNGLDSFAVVSSLNDFDTSPHASGVFFDEYLKLDLGIYESGTSNRIGSAAYELTTHLKSHKINFWIRDLNDNLLGGWTVSYPFSSKGLYPNQSLLLSRNINGQSYSNLILDSVATSSLLIDESFGAVSFKNASQQVNNLLNYNFI